MLGGIYFKRYPGERERYVMPMKSVLGSVTLSEEDLDRMPVILAHSALFLITKKL